MFAPAVVCAREITATSCRGTWLQPVLWFQAVVELSKVARYSCNLTLVHHQWTEAVSQSYYISMDVLNLHMYTAVHHISLLYQRLCMRACGVVQCVCDFTTVCLWHLQAVPSG